MPCRSRWFLSYGILIKKKDIEEAKELEDM